MDAGSVSSMAATEEAGKLFMGQALPLPTSLVKPYCFRNWQVEQCLVAPNSEDRFLIDSL